MMLYSCIYHIHQPSFYWLFRGVHKELSRKLKLLLPSLDITSLHGPSYALWMAYLLVNGVLAGDNPMFLASFLMTNSLSSSTSTRPPSYYREAHFPLDCGKKNSPWLSCLVSQNICIEHNFTRSSSKRQLLDRGMLFPTPEAQLSPNPADSQPPLFREGLSLHRSLAFSQWPYSLGYGVTCAMFTIQQWKV